MARRWLAKNRAGLHTADLASNMLRGSIESPFRQATQSATTSFASSTTMLPEGSPHALSNTV